MQAIGYLAVIIAASTFVFVLIMVVVGMILGAVHAKNAETIEDPMENDPDVISGTAPPLAKGEMNPFESSSVKPSLPYVIGALLAMIVIIGFSAYGLREMAGSTGTTDAMRAEAKARAKKNQKKYQTGPAIEDMPEDDKKKKRSMEEALTR